LPHVTDGGRLLRVNKLLSIVALTLALILPQNSLAAELGKLCIAPIDTPSSGAKSLSNPSGGNYAGIYAVRIDRLSPVNVARRHAIAIAGLSPSENHLIRIMRDEKDVTAFHFRFDDYEGRDLCLWFGPLYQTWRLSSARGRGENCVCQ
jgi:hypothetical protein